MRKKTTITVTIKTNGEDICVEISDNLTLATMKIQHILYLLQEITSLLVDMGSQGIDVDRFTHVLSVLNGEWLNLGIIVEGGCFAFGTTATANTIRVG